MIDHPAMPKARPDTSGKLDKYDTGWIRGADATLRSVVKWLEENNYNKCERNPIPMTLCLNIDDWQSLKAAAEER